MAFGQLFQVELENASNYSTQPVLRFVLTESKEITAIVAYISCSIWKRPTKRNYRAIIRPHPTDKRFRDFWGARVVCFFFRIRGVIVFESYVWPFGQSNNHRTITRFLIAKTTARGVYPFGDACRTLLTRKERKCTGVISLRIGGVIRLKRRWFSNTVIREQISAFVH